MCVRSWPPACGKSPGRCATRLTSTAPRRAAERSRASSLSGPALQIQASPKRCKTSSGSRSRPDRRVRRRGDDAAAPSRPSASRWPPAWRSRRRRDEGRQPDPRRTAAGAGSLTGRSGGGALIVLGVIAGLAVLIFMYGSASHQISSQTGEAAALERAGRSDQGAHRTGWRRTRPSSRWPTSARKPSRNSCRRASTGRTPCTSLAGCCPPDTSLASLHGSGRTGGRGSLELLSTATAPAAGSTPASSTPPGSTPVFTLTGCATSQSVVAQTLQRLKLMDGASEVQLQSSTKSGKSGSSARRLRRGRLPGQRSELLGAGHFHGAARRTIADGPSSGRLDRRRQSWRARAGRAPGQWGAADDRARPADAGGGRRARRLVGAWFTESSRPSANGGEGERRSQAARQQVASAESQADSAASARAQYSTAYASLVSLGQAVPSTPETPALIYELDKATHSRDVQFSSITSGTSGSAGSSARAQPRRRERHRGVHPAALHIRVQW